MGFKIICINHLLLYNLPYFSFLHCLFLHVSVCVCLCVSTVRCLGGLSGGMLLGMTLEELKIVCPEEGRRVFYQLQNVKSVLAVRTEHTHTQTYTQRLNLYLKSAHCLSVCF